MRSRPDQSYAIAAWILLVGTSLTHADAPPFADYCQRLQQEVQGKKHGFLAGNLTYYVGGFHASWDLKEHETLGLTHPFHHDLRSRGVGLVQSRGRGQHDTGLGNDFSGWEFYKDTRVLYGTVVVDQTAHRHPVPQKMYWRPDRMICEYDVGGVRLREEKFIAANDVACSMITASRPVTLRFNGQSFFGRHSLTSSATIAYDAEHNAIHIVEGGTTKCRPETDRSEQAGPIMYQGMSTVLAASQNIAAKHTLSTGKQGQMQYEFELNCDSRPVTIVWAMHDDYQHALEHALDVLRDPRQALLAKTREMNRQLNEEIPSFRCSDSKFEEIYYYLWSLYLMYDIDVQHGWEREAHTQTAVNNFLGMHRYDATFQIKVGSWAGNKPHYAYGNVLTWKHLFASGHYRTSPNGVVALADNKGTTWHSGVYGLELAEHVVGAWQIYQHTADIEFLRSCYQDYFREVFRKQIPAFFSNHFEVAEILIAMARLTGYDRDVEHWQTLVSQDPNHIRHWFDQRWQANGFQKFFAGPPNGMLMTTGFWHMRSKHFPRDYAVQMTDAWATNTDKGFMGDFFPLAMSRQAMRRFTSKPDQAFGYTPDTAYFTLSGMFRQRLGDPAWKLAVNHLENYNYQADWKIPVAPEAYTRSGKLFGDQYSNFNAGKLLIFLEGLAGLEYSLPENTLIVHDTMPKTWTWMEVRIPLRTKTDRTNRWPVIRYERSRSGNEITKSIRVRDCPLQVQIEPWSEGLPVIGSHNQPAPLRTSSPSRYPHYRRYTFDPDRTEAAVTLQLDRR